MPQGWLLKRAPKADDADKDKAMARRMMNLGKTMLSLFTSHALYTRRWFVLTEKFLIYYKTVRAWAAVAELRGPCGSGCR